MSSDLHALSGAYAVDALSTEEAAEFRKHLEHCPACQQEVRELQEAAALMGASEQMSPPDHLKANVMRAADQTPQMPPRVRHIGTAGAARWGPRLVAVAAAVVLVVAGAIGFSQLSEDSASTLAAPVSAVFNAPDVHETTVQTSNGGKVAVATSDELGKMAVDTDELPALKSGQVYQLWAIEKGKPHSAGLLDDPAKGAAMAKPGRGIQVAITIEPAGGSDQPTTQPIMSVVPSEV